MFGGTLQWTLLNAMSLLAGGSVRLPAQPSASAWGHSSPNTEARSSCSGDAQFRKRRSVVAPNVRVAPELRHIRDHLGSPNGMEERAVDVLRR
jgi:hypothetical protein